MSVWLGAQSYVGAAGEEKKEQKRERKRRHDVDSDDDDIDMMGEAGIAIPGGGAPRAAPAAAAVPAIPADDSDDDAGAVHAGGDQEHADDGEQPGSLLDGDDCESEDEETKAERRATPRGTRVWCFAREYAAHLTEDSPIQDQLAFFRSQYGRGILTPKQLAKNMRKWFKKEIYPMLPAGQRHEWIESVIIEYLEYTADEEAQRQMLTRMAFKKLCIIGNTKMCTVDPVTRKIKDRPDDDVRFHQFARTWMQLQKRR